MRRVLPDHDVGVIKLVFQGFIRFGPSPICRADFSESYVRNQILLLQTFVVDGSFNELAAEEHVRDVSVKLEGMQLCKAVHPRCMSPFTAKVRSSGSIFDQLSFQPRGDGARRAIGIPSEGNIRIFGYFLLDVRFPTNRLCVTNEVSPDEDAGDDQGENHGFSSGSKK